MYEQGEDVFYYLTLGNENYAQPALPEGAREGILNGMYRFRPSPLGDGTVQAHLLGSGAILREVLAAQSTLAERYGIAADVWSVTSYTELRREALEAERWNMLHPGRPARIPYVRQCLSKAPGVFVAASDYLKALPDSIAKWLPRPLIALGTDGFGRSEARAELRHFFEVDRRHVTLATLYALARDGEIDPEQVQSALKDLNIDPEKRNPART